ncbi:hypothetical protein QMA67_14925 [Gluconobacter japonicus]|uniref:hypothetical protein n=1 Tax=Gluconobacter japonicus TaxID=376620 RepID=UPI0024ACA2F6|nr:hypothetical protein [Gluconobacter japonicus]MDI6654214.1 hypothetical protein [Gluconobacter japonicus]
MDLDEYINRIVDPTFLDFQKNPSSGRHAFLACIVVYHSVDYASFPNKTKEITEYWSKNSIEFAIVDMIANHIKNVKLKIEKLNDINKISNGIPLSSIIIKGDISGDSFGLDLHNLYYYLRDAIIFIKNYSKNTKILSEIEL